VGVWTDRRAKLPKLSGSSAWSIEGVAPNDDLIGSR
jgi:hypothetical protein